MDAEPERAKASCPLFESLTQSEGGAYAFGVNTFPALKGCAFKTRLLKGR